MNVFACQSFDRYKLFKVKFVYDYYGIEEIMIDISLFFLCYMRGVGLFKSINKSTDGASQHSKFPKIIYNLFTAISAI